DGQLVGIQLRPDGLGEGEISAPRADAQRRSLRQGAVLGRAQIDDQGPPPGAELAFGLEALDLAGLRGFVSSHLLPGDRGRLGGWGVVSVASLTGRGGSENDAQRELLAEGSLAHSLPSRSWSTRASLEKEGIRRRFR